MYKRFCFTLTDQGGEESSLLDRLLSSGETGAFTADVVVEIVTVSVGVVEEVAAGVGIGVVEEVGGAGVGAGVVEEVVATVTDHEGVVPVVVDVILADDDGDDKNGDEAKFSNRHFHLPDVQLLTD